MNLLQGCRKTTLKLLLVVGIVGAAALPLRAEAVRATTPATTFRYSFVLAQWQEQFDAFRTELAREMLVASMTMFADPIPLPPPPPPPPAPSGEPTGDPVPPSPSNSGGSSPNTTPEPTSLLAGLIGLATLAGYRLRRRKGGEA